MASTLSVVLFIVDIPLYIFHLSMILFLIVQIARKIGDFGQGFFVLYVAVSIADCFYMAHVS